jgi:glycosyltransferase involved in cell wall biosynthesis
MENPAISVAMSVYNGERFLVEAIESILGQSYADFEFLIVDDGSRDSSTNIISEYAAKDSRIRPILRENRGLIASLNEMLSVARAPIVARMDADDASRPERFALQKAFLDEHPDYGVVGTWSEEFDEEGRSLVGSGPDQPITYEELLTGIETGEQLVCHPTAMYRRDVVLSVGGYHAAFRHCEDYDLWLRLANVTRIGNIAQRMMRYRRHAGQVTEQHTIEVHVGAAIALLAYRERQQGRRDPTAEFENLPGIDELDELFGQEGLSDAVREKAALGLRWSADAMRGNGYDLLMRHLREGGRREGMWRTVARLMRFGIPLKALRLAAVLLTRRRLSASAC